LVDGAPVPSTIQEGVRALAPGDTLCLHAGTYVEAISVSASGTPAAPISIVGYPGEVVIVDGQSLYPTADWGALVSVSGNYVNLSDIEVRNSSAKNAMGVVLIGHHVKVSRFNVHHTHQNGILIRGDYGVVEDSRVWQAAQANKPPNANTSGWASGLSAARDPTNGITDKAVIRRNTVFNNWGEGVSTFEANGTVIEDNVVYDNWASNTYISDASNVIFRNNLAYRSANSLITNGLSDANLSLADEVASMPRSAKNVVINNAFLNGPVDLFSWTNVAGSALDRVLFTNNTLIDSYFNVGTLNNASVIQNNVYYMSTGDSDFGLVLGKVGLTFANNCWSDLVPVNASGTGDVVNDPMLAQAGSTLAGLVTRDYFKKYPASPTYGKGRPISATTDTVTVTSGTATLDIGAYVGTSIPVQYR
jgi:hypothetical protein